MSKTSVKLRACWVTLSVAVFALVVSMSSLGGVAAPKKEAASKGPTATPKSAGPTQAPTATPTPTPTPSPPPIPFFLQNKKKIVFVLAVGDDRKTSKMLLAGFTQHMQPRVPENVVLISQPDWTTANILTQCAPKPPSRVASKIAEQNVQGYLIIRLLATTSWISHRILKEVPTSAIDADALYAECQPSLLPEHAAYTWHENALYELGTRKVLNLSALSLVFPLIALYEAVIPSKTSTTTTTRTFPTPPGGGVSQVVDTTSSSTNSNQGSSTNTLTAAILTGAIDYSKNVAQAIPPGDAETWDAVNIVSENIAIRACPQKAEAPPTPSNVAPFCMP